MLAGQRFPTTVLERLRAKYIKSHASLKSSFVVDCSKPFAVRVN
jgi:hypothetical protein